MSRTGDELAGELAAIAKATHAVTPVRRRLFTSIPCRVQDSHALRAARELLRRDGLRRIVDWEKVFAARPTTATLALREHRTP